MAEQPKPAWWSAPYTYIEGKFTPFVFDAARKAWVLPKPKPKA